MRFVVVCLSHASAVALALARAELFYDRGNHFEFLSVEKELLPAGILEKSQEFPFEFLNAAKQHECYSGVNVRLRCAKTLPAPAQRVCS